MLPELALVTSILGTILVIAPTFSKVRRLITKTSRIDKLDEGRLELLHFNRIDKDDESFKPVKEAVKSRTDDIEGDIYAFHPLAFGSFGGGGIVYLFNKKMAQHKNPFNEYDPVELESILIINEWLSQEISDLRSKPTQTVRGVGLIIIILSVIIQAFIISL